MSLQEIISETSPFLLEALETCLGPYEALYDEQDCLNINLFMPTTALVSSPDNMGSSARLPVFVWLFGGGFRRGGNGIPLLDATNFVALIVVIPNYCTNYLGFLSSKELLLDNALHTTPLGSVGNWGLQDLIMALEWVQEHITHFGGNPARVTLAGESAGAVSIGHLMRVQQKRQGLFHRAIVQSGAAAMVPAGYPEQDGQLYFDHLCRVFKVREGIEGAGKVEWLRENVIITGTLGCHTLEKFKVLRTQLCGEKAASLQLFDRLYGIPVSDAAALEASVQLTTDGMFHYPLLALSQHVQASSSNCRLSRFHFDCSLQTIREANPSIGAHHGSDLLFLFGADEVSRHLTEQEKAVSAKMQEVWIQVATSDLSKDTSEEKSLLNQEAVWFKENCTVKFTSWSERLSEDKIAFWQDSIEHHSKQAALGLSPDVGFALLKPIVGA
ncbi:hypothetical protein BGZ82_007737 [Podila clonocystis]|nr:hypothetical protein BGZ82_007737 [Podila clonocystis]